MRPVYPVLLQGLLCCPKTDIYPERGYTSSQHPQILRKKTPFVYTYPRPIYVQLKEGSLG